MSRTDSHELMRRLAAARPAHLDPELPVPATTRAAELSRAMAAPAALAAAPVPPQRVVRRPYAWGGGLLATATAVTLLVISATFGSGPAGQPGHWKLDAVAPRTGAAADSVLLAAANTAATQDLAQDGRYWRVDYEMWQQFAARDSAEKYGVAGGARETHSTDTETGEFCGSGQNFPFAPASSDDREVWEKDGSPNPVSVTIDLATAVPRVFKVGSGDRMPLWGDADSMGSFVKIWPRAGSPNLKPTREAPFLLGGRGLGLEQLNALPTDPEALRDELLTGYTGKDKAAAGSREKFLFDAARTLLLDVPVSGEIQAAAFRMLAGLEGVTVIGDVTDVTGRKGTAAALTTPGENGGTLQDRLIFDEATSRGLTADTVVVDPAGDYADYRAGAIISAESVEKTEWTDSKMPKPCPVPMP
ncbi:CU044_5270 family protein [Streptomyces sp. B5E4]|uniref:CU044_5270 family protein n=1 Tax=Streptomyces sp. B5E4 TaxID=3153568 RepID=UPI00325CB9A3